MVDVARLAVAVMFLAAGMAKAVRLPAFADYIGFRAPTLNRLAALIVVMCEFLTALALLRAMRLGALAASVLLVIFSVFLSVRMVVEKDISACSCWGVTRQHHKGLLARAGVEFLLPAWHATRNGVFLATGIWLLTARGATGGASFWLPGIGLFIPLGLGLGTWLLVGPRHRRQRRTVQADDFAARLQPMVVLDYYRGAAIETSLVRDRRRLPGEPSGIPVSRSILGRVPA
jgi:hypothetical protein